MLKLRYILPLLLITLFVQQVQAQSDSTKTVPDSAIYFYEPDFVVPRQYIIGGITLTGTRFLDQNILVMLSGLSLNQKITVPGEEIPKAIENLWKQKFFTAVEIQITREVKDSIFLNIVVEEKPRLSRFSLSGPGLKKSDIRNLRDELSLQQGDIVTENLLNNTRNQILDYYKEKGYINTKVEITEEPDPDRRNSSVLRLRIVRGPRVKVNDILFEGNNVLSDAQLRRTLKETKRIKFKLNVFKSSKFIEDKYEEDKKNIIVKYNSLGYRDAVLVSDTIYYVRDNRVNISIKVSEGHKYYFGNISFIGNSKYRTSQLDSVLRIKKGDIYNQTKLDSRLFMSADGMDISSLYMDDGYLFFTVVPIETRIENDSIDLEIRITEGTQAVYGDIEVVGNTKTSDHVVLRELRTKPGQKFSRSDIQRSIRELATLGMFDPEQLDVNPVPNPYTGTVDLTYKVVEKPSDQIELSGGWGGYGGLVGTLGLTLNNFSARKMFKPKQWNPIPAGDGQRLSLRAQSNGLYYQSYNASFTEPWLGGKKPISFTASVYHSVQVFNYLKKSDPDRADIYTTGASIALGKRLKWPDDFFTLQASINYQQYLLHNANRGGTYPQYFLFNEGTSNNFNLRFVLARNSIDQPIYPRSGSQITLSLQVTPPYSLLNGKDYTNAPDDIKYRWIEYHKWKFDAIWYTSIWKDLVLTAQGRFGFMGYYNNDIGYAPFERFILGGSGLYGYNLYGAEVIAQRGYPDNSLSGRVGSPIYNKFTLEMRYPVSLNPSATIYLLTFMEGGNAWNNFRDYNPFEIKRAVGGGVRIFMPMFGMLGVDYGYGFDIGTVPNYQTENKGRFHFFLGQQF